MSRCGLHTSTAGGLGQMLLRSRDLGEDAAQIFVKSNRQWRISSLAESEANAFRRGKALMNLWICAHAGYLINVAGQGETRKKSIQSLGEELARAEELELEALVVHCGSRGDLGSQEARKRAVAGFIEALERSGTVRIVLALENSAGQGSSLAQDTGEWGELVAGLPHARGAACLDTAHAFAAGHDLTRAEGRDQLIREVKEKIGWDRVKVLHVNDSKSACGSHVDRHEHLGRGKIGAASLRSFLRNPALRGIPRIGELPPGEKEDRDNLKFLRSCG
ncbi:deoxyribonuclease IV [bacterium]|nr:deoxyribonuclease IV [bacterium]NDA26482.1 deoxyribonuclease IV [Verrucomicrobiota bacterium]